MSSGINLKIWMALKGRIDTLPLPYPKAWPAETFELPTDGNTILPYLRIGRVVASPVGEMINYGKPHLRTGFIIVTLVYPMSRGEIPKDNAAAFYDNIAGEIAEHFRDGTHVSFDGVCVSVTNYPHVQEGYSDGGYWNVPVRIPWRTFV